MDSFIEFWSEYTFFGFHLSQIAIFAGIIFVTFFMAKFIEIIFIKFLQNQAAKTKTDFDDNLVDIAKGPLNSIVYVIGFYFALLTLNPQDAIIPLKSIITAFTETSVAIIITWFCFGLVDVFDKCIVSQFKTDKDSKETLILHFFPLIKRALKITIAFIAIIIIIQNQGYSVASLLAGFGITGLAVGFAAKESIANVFGSISVVVDKAYKVGDWIVVDKSVAGANAEGIVEDITLRSTKIRAFDNTVLIIPNNVMANATIKNVSMHQKRRIFEYIDITYDTPVEKVEKAVEICRQAVRNHPGMLEYQQIHLNKLASHSLQIIFYVFTKTTDWGEYLAIRQELFLTIMKEFEKLGVEFAFPTQTLYLNEQNKESNKPLV